MESRSLGVWKRFRWRTDREKVEPVTKRNPRHIDGYEVLDQYI